MIRIAICDDEKHMSEHIMRVNETGDMFMIDWTYDEYYFAIYGKSP